MNAAGKYIGVGVSFSGCSISGTTSHGGQEMLNCGRKKPMTQAAQRRGKLTRPPQRGRPRFMDNIHSAASASLVGAHPCTVVSAASATAPGSHATRRNAQLASCYPPICMDCSDKCDLRPAIHRAMGAQAGPLLFSIGCLQLTTLDSKR